MTTLELIFAIFGWVFGLISTVCAIIQTISKTNIKNYATNKLQMQGMEQPYLRLEVL